MSSPQESPPRKNQKILYVYINPEIDKTVHELQGMVGGSRSQVVREAIRTFYALKTWQIKHGNMEIRITDDSGTTHQVLIP